MIDVASAVFVRTRHSYDSYSDFWKLVELSGLATCYVEEIRLDSEFTYIVTPINGEFRPHIKNEQERVGSDRRARVIWWCLERPDADGIPPLKDVIDEIAPYIDGAWASDRTVAGMDARLTHVVLGGHPGLCPDPAALGTLGAEYDFAHMSYAWGRRENLYMVLAGRGLRMAPIAYGQARHEILLRTRLMLNAQQYHLPVIAPLRFAIAAAYRLPVVSERPADPYPHVLGHDLVGASYEEMVPAVLSALIDEDRLRALGAAMHETLCERHTFRRGVEEGLPATRWFPR